MPRNEIRCVAEGTTAACLAIRAPAGRRGRAGRKARRPAGVGLWAFRCSYPAHALYTRYGLAEVEPTYGVNNQEREPDVRLAWTPRPPS